MNPIVFAMRRPVTTLMLVVALVSGGVLGMSKLRGDIFPPLNTPKIYAYLDYIGMCAKQTKEYIVGQYESYFHKDKERRPSTSTRRSWSPALRQRTSSSPSNMSARSTRSATSMSVPWRTGISRRSRSRRARR